MLATALIVALLGGTWSAEPERSATVTCRPDRDPDARIFVLEQNEGRWSLTLKSKTTGGRWIRLPLPNASPAITADTVRLSYRNANGGRQVDLTVTPGRSSLDVWVDYGLEVNIEPDLDPQVDLMNTEGPLSNVTCEMSGRQGAAAGRAPM